MCRIRNITSKEIFTMSLFMIDPTTERRFNMKINEKIRALRIRSRLTQNQTADFLDVTQPFIAEVENGTAALTADMLNRLSALYCVPLEYLIGDNEDCLPSADDLSSYSTDDLKAIAVGSKIALNAHLMTNRLKANKVL